MSVGSNAALSNVCPSHKPLFAENIQRAFRHKRCRGKGRTTVHTRKFHFVPTHTLIWNKFFIVLPHMPLLHGNFLAKSSTSPWWENSFFFCRRSPCGIFWKFASCNDDDFEDVMQPNADAARGGAPEAPMKDP